MAISGEQPYPGWSWWETVPGVKPVGNRIRGGAGGKPYLGWSRGKAVSGVELVGNRIWGGAGGKPYPALLQDLPMLWTVGISPLGEAARGAGELVPPPLSPTLQPSCFSPASLARAFAGRLPTHFYRHPHPTRAFGAPPPPRPGAGAVLAISGDQPCPGWSRGETVFGVEPMESRARRSALCAGFSGEVRSPFFSGLSPRGGPWRLSPRGGPAMPGIYPDGRPPFSPLSGPFPYISGEVTAPGAGCPPGLSGGNVSAACMWAGAVCGEGLLKLYMG